MKVTRLELMARKIKSAERALGPLTLGQRSDMLLDHFEDAVDSEHAKYILATLERFGMISPAVKANNL